MRVPLWIEQTGIWHEIAFDYISKMCYPTVNIHTVVLSDESSPSPDCTRNGIRNLEFYRHLYYLGWYVS